MKKLLLTLALTIAFASSPAAFAQAKKKAAAPAAAPAADAKPAADAAKPAEKPAAPAAKAPKPLPFSSTADEIDAAGKSFTHTNADGKKVKNVVTDKTEIKNGEPAAKFEDIKVGDKVSGLRLKKNEDGTEYEVVKITKFAAAAAKKAAAPAEMKEKPTAVEKKDKKKADKAAPAAAAPAAAVPAAK